MLRDKMLKIINEVNSEVSEREELIECIALALLTRKNLFVLGDTGQAKSFAVNCFRSRIQGAKQFERLLSKQADEEQLFGRLDLASLIPGSMSQDELLKDNNYASFHDTLKKLHEQYSTTNDEVTRRKMVELTEATEQLKKTLSVLNGSSPKMITTGKIPDSHIVFLDEIFKANDGLLNSLLTALNERKYTNEGYTTNIPVISFFSASNEIPNFNDPAEKILKPLYDRFELKVVTRYVEDRQNRLDMLSKKQSGNISSIGTNITLDELYAIQADVGNIVIPNSINELMDDVLCELRKNNIHVSDRKYFNYYPIAQAKAWLDGATEVESTHLLALKNYLWNAPDELTVVEQILTRMCQNPLQDKLSSIIAMGSESMDEAIANKDNKKSFIKFRAEFIRLYDMLCDLKLKTITDNEKPAIEKALTELEAMSQKAHKEAGFTYAKLDELKALQ